MKAGIKSSAEAAPEYGEYETPQAPEGQQIVDLVATGLHQLVLARANGTHYTSSGVYPQIPGVDAVARTADGRLVYIGFGFPGTLAEKFFAPATGAVELPSGADPCQVAAGLNPGLASWVPLNARLREVDALGTVLILGATGMSGMLAIQNAVDLGATRVLAAGRNPDALARAAERGAEPLQLSGDTDTDIQTMTALLDGAAPDVVLDFIWGQPAEAVFGLFDGPGRAPAAGSSFVQIGNLAGPTARVPAHMLRSNKITVRGSGIGAVSLADFIAEIPRYVERVGSGAVQVPYRSFPLSDVTAAWEQAGKGGDRVVVVPD